MHNKLIKQWLYGFVIILGWICVSYTAAAVISQKYLYAGIYVVLALIVAGILIKVLPKITIERVKYSPWIIFLTTGLLLLNFIIQSILQYQSSQTNSMTTPANYATYTTTVVIFLVLIVTLYTYWTQEKQ